MHLRLEFCYCLDSPLISCSSAKGGDDSYFLLPPLFSPCFPVSRHCHFWLEVVNEVDFCLLLRIVVSTRHTQMVVRE